jgi:hypothetical protein
MKYRQIFVFALVLFSVSCSQQRLKETQLLKKHGLAFMLHDYQRRIEHFERSGMAEKAQAERLKIAEQNRAIAQHFKEEFDFCPVYFFYASQRAELAARKPVLLNDQLQPDPSIPLPDVVIMADYGLGNLKENTHKLESFRIDSLGIKISPTYKTRYKGEILEARDIRKFDKKLTQMSGQ